MSSNKSKKNKKKKKKNYKHKNGKGENNRIYLEILNEDIESDKSESLEEDEIKTLAEKFNNIWTYQTINEEKDKEENKKITIKVNKQLLETVKRLEFNMYTKLDLTTHSIEQILNKISENIRPSIDDYLNIYNKVEDKDIILN